MPIAPSPIRPDWLAQSQEMVIDPALPIIDAHHHLFDRVGHRYLAADYLADTETSRGTGHNIIASVFVQARAFYRTTGPEVLYPVGETEFAAAQESPAQGLKMNAAIVGFADLTLGMGVAAQLAAHVTAGRGRFRGVRQILAWDADMSLLNPSYPTREDMMQTPAFIEGFEQLARFDLSFDAWLLAPQLPRLAALARAFPQTAIALNHCGGILGAGAYANKRDLLFDKWHDAIADLATCPNVYVKIGGLGMVLSGFGFDQRYEPPSSAYLASEWRPWVAALIAAFGPKRVMFESNFPADKASFSYNALWNAFKRLTSDANSADRHAMFCGTAQQFYRIDLPNTPTT